MATKAGNVSKIPKTREKNIACICKMIFFGIGYFWLCFKFKKSPI